MTAGDHSGRIETGESDSIEVKISSEPFDIEAQAAEIESLAKEIFVRVASELIFGKKMESDLKKIIETCRIMAIEFLRHRIAVVPQYEPEPKQDQTEDLSIRNQLREFEQKLIKKALLRTGGNLSKAAVLLGISHRALLYKVKEYGIPS